MTVTGRIDPTRLVEEQLAQASPDLPRELLQAFADTDPANHRGLIQPYRRITLNTSHQRN